MALKRTVYFLAFSKTENQFSSERVQVAARICMHTVAQTSAGIWSGWSLVRTSIQNSFRDVFFSFWLSSPCCYCSCRGVHSSVVRSEISLCTCRTFLIYCGVTSIREAAHQRGKKSVCVWDHAPLQLLPYSDDIKPASLALVRVFQNKHPNRSHRRDGKQQQ